MQRSLKAGWRIFHCDTCGEKWESASRDRASPSGEECPCGEWVFPHAARPDDTLLCNEYGNLAKTYERKVINAT
jgi:hypothetical protein